MRGLFGRIEKVVVGWFKRFERPIAWMVFVTGIFGFIGTMMEWWVTGDAQLVTMVGFGLMALDGFGVVQEVEPDLGDPRLDDIDDDDDSVYPYKNTC